MQRVRQQGSVLFCYNAVRPLGEDFEESVGYNFTFLEGGRMTMEGGISWDFSGLFCRCRFPNMSKVEELYEQLA